MKWYTCGILISSTAYTFAMQFPSDRAALNYMVIKNQPSSYCLKEFSTFRQEEGQSLILPRSVSCPDVLNVEKVRKPLLREGSKRLLLLTPTQLGMLIASSLFTSPRTATGTKNAHKLEEAPIDN